MARGVSVVQLGARSAYALPRTLSQLGLDVQLVTDLYRHSWSGALLSQVSSRARARGHAALKGVRVRDNAVFAVRYALAQRMRLGKSLYQVYGEFSDRFGSWAAGVVNPQSEAVVAYSGAARSLFERLRGRMPLVLVQIDAGYPAEALIREEYERFAEWEQDAFALPGSEVARQRDEWDLADVIVVNSAHTRRALTGAGVPPGKMVVIPLAYESGRTPAAKQAVADGTRLLFVGRLTIRKGVHRLAEACSRLRSSGVGLSLSLAGKSYLRPAMLRKVRREHDVLGEIPHAGIDRVYAAHDLFVFPTLTDGFGLVQLEALSHGLPVIATRNCADIVEDGLTGLRIAAGSTDELCDAIERSVGIMRGVGFDTNAMESTLTEYSIANVSERWRSVVSGLMHPW